MNETQTPTRPSLIIRRTFKAPRARVFAAWTDPALLRQWFGPPGMTVPEAQIDLRVGGSYRITMLSADGEKYIVGGIFTDILAPERLAYTFRWEEDDPALEHDTLVSLAFLDRGSETELVFKQEDFADAESRDRHEHGWSATFEQLPAVL